MKTTICECGQLLALFSKTQCKDCKALYDAGGQLLSSPRTSSSSKIVKIDGSKILQAGTAHQRATQHGLWDIILPASLN